MLRIRPVSMTVTAVVLATALAGCNSLPSVPSFGNEDTRETVNGWIEDLIADLGFGSMVSTEIGDAHPMVPWLEGLSHELSPKEGTSFELEPGYYRFRVESFCLEPGAYGPEETEGHLLAPLSGQRVRLVQSILTRAGDHPEIPQGDIQRFLWGIDAGLSLSDFPDDVRNRVQPLLTSQEVLQLSIDGGKIAKYVANSFLPQEAQELLARYQQVRALLTDVQSTYEALEEVAVRLGAAPAGPGSQPLDSGHWSYAGDGFYARTIPESYSVTALEVLRPAPYQIERDSLGRIVHFESGDYGIKASYDDQPGPNVLRGPNGEEGRIWHFKRLEFSGPGKGQRHVLRNRGWIVAADPTLNASAFFNSADDAGNATVRVRDPYELAKNMYASNGLILAQVGRNRQVSPKWADYSERAKQGVKVVKDLKQYREEWQRATRPPDERAFRDIVDLKHFRDGVKAAKNPADLEGKGSWFRDHLGRLRNAWNYASCVLAGDCAPPDMEENPLRRRFDPTRTVSTPSNTSRQPLGLTRRLVESRVEQGSVPDDVERADNGERDPFARPGEPGNRGLEYGDDGPIPAAARTKVEKAIHCAYAKSMDQAFIDTFNKTVSTVRGNPVPTTAYLDALDRMQINLADTSSDARVQDELAQDARAARQDPLYQLPPAFSEVNGTNVWLRERLLTADNVTDIAAAITHEAAHLAGAPNHLGAEIVLQGIAASSSCPD